MDTTDRNRDDKSVTQRQACDHCKIRKTKCDRNSPCSSCIATKVQCRVTRRTPEKRQRVLLSSKYDEAVESVNQRLVEISATLQKLAEEKEFRPKQSPDSSHDISIFEQLTDVSCVYEGFTGDSSLRAHVEQAANALESAYALHPNSVLGGKHAQQAGDNDSKSNDIGTDSHTTRQGQSPSLESLPLPNMDPVLRLLRLSQSEKQRFFLDYPLITEHELSSLCQQVYFATEPYSLTTWILVNVGLAFMFKSLKEAHFAQVGMDAVDVESTIRLLTLNLDFAVQKLKLCLEPTVEGCQALVLLAAFCVNTGRIAIAWKLVTAASRMCLDLGLHRLPSNGQGRELSRNNLLFWTVYAWDKGMSLTLGRAPSIHHYDVTSPSPWFTEEMAGFSQHVFMGFHHYAIAAGDAHRELFSASAMKDTQVDRVRRAKNLAARLSQTQASFQKAAYKKDPENSTVLDQSIMLDIILYCLLTVVMRIIPVNKPDPHSLQCCNECVDAARNALTMLHNVGLKRQHDPGKWSMYLNTIFSFAPFLPFIVLVGNAIATSSSSDLQLLSSLLAMMQPAAKMTPAIRKLCDVCRDFYQIADKIVAQVAPKAPAIHAAYKPPQAIGGTIPALNNVNGLFARYETTASNTGDIPMSQQDWTSVVNEFDLDMDGLDVEAIATFIEPYINDRLM